MGHLKNSKIKIPSHSGIEENNTVDFIAKCTAIIAKDCKYGKSKFMKYNQFYNPVHVDISIDLKRLRYKQRQNRIEEWKLEHKNWNMRNLNENMYKGDMIFHKMILGHNEYVKRSTNDMKEELKFLKPYETSIITKLRTECINLNEYKNFRFKDENHGYHFCAEFRYMRNFFFKIIILYPKKCYFPVTRMTLALMRIVLTNFVSVFP